MKEMHLGDAVYAEYNDGEITIWLEYGEGRENQIILGELEWKRLVEFVNLQETQAHFNVK